VQILVACGASLFILLQRMGVAGCGSQCDFTQLQLAGDGFVAVAVILAIITGVMLLIPSRRPDSSVQNVWVPVLGIVLTLVSACIASLLIGAAIDPA